MKTGAYSCHALRETESNKTNMETYNPTVTSPARRAASQTAVTDNGVCERTGHCDV